MTEDKHDPGPESLACAVVRQAMEDISMLRKHGYIDHWKIKRIPATGGKNMADPREVLRWVKCHSVTWCACHGLTMLHPVEMAEHVMEHGIPDKQPRLRCR